MKKTISILLALVLMLSLFTGCGGTKAPAEEKPAEQPGDEVVEQTPEVKEDPYEVRMIIALPAQVPEQAELDRVMAAINEITLPELNMTLKLEPLPFSVFSEQVNLALSAGEKLDLLTTIQSSAPTQVNSGYLLDLEPLLAEYGPDIVDTYVNEELAKVCTVSGTLYGFPVHKEVCMQQTIFFRTDILEKHNIDVSNIKSIADIDAIYEQVAALEPGMWMVAPEVGGLIKTAALDNVGGSKTTVAIVDPATNTDVVNLIETDAFREWCEYAHKWYEKGWINSGVASDTESYYSYIASGQAFSFFSDYGHPLSENDQEANCSGTDLTMVTFAAPISTTQTSAVFSYSIPAGSEQPEKAMQMLNFIMTDSRIMNLINWGEEGVDYVVNEEGLLDFPEGKDASTVGYRLNAGWILPNQFVCTPWENLGADVYEKVAAYNETTTLSKALGFTFDPADVSDIVAAVSNVYDKYYKALQTGAVDPDEYIPIYVQELKDAGIDILIEEVQTQLDAWLASK